MARPGSPEFAAKLATGVSAEERQVLQEIARIKRVKLAAVVRWAVEEYVANHRDMVRQPVRAVAIG